MLIISKNLIQEGHHLGSGTHIHGAELALGNAACDCSQRIAISTNRNGVSDRIFKACRFKECHHRLRYGVLTGFVELIGISDLIKRKVHRIVFALDDFADLLQLTAANETVANTQAQLDEANAAAFAGIEPKAAEVLAKVQEGGDFDALIAEYGEDSGMTVEPAKTQGYAVCEGLQMYVTEFQDAAMALGAVGDVSGLVKTSFGYHILKYAQDIESGAVEYTDEIKEAIHAEMLTAAQDAAYDAAVTQWVSEAKVETFPKVME